jgi:hypothetical protein
MSIITEVPYWKVIEKELRTSFELQRETEAARERLASKRAQEGNGKILGKGKLELRKLATIPARDFYQVQQKYGTGVWFDNEFLGDFKKHNPHLTTIYCPERRKLKSVS